MVTGKDFFKGTGRWPVAFTIWRYSERNNNNKIKLLDLTDIDPNAFFKINWNDTLENINSEIKKSIRGKKEILFDISRGDIRDSIPLLLNSKSNELERQQMYDFKRSPTKNELEEMTIYGGLPINDTRRDNKKTYGSHDGQYIGIMDNGTPVRISQDKYFRMSTLPDRVWFRLDNDLKSCNKTRITSGPTDKYSYCAYNIDSAKSLFSWFTITKIINGVYPIWANQFDIWQPSIISEYDEEYYSLCFSFSLSVNSCIVTKFENNNPVQNTTEIFIDNPLCPLNPDSFWATTLANQISSQIAIDLVAVINDLYEHWNSNYCKGQFLENVGLSDEPYFKYFSYSDFVTPYSGLIQIKKYAEINGKTDILDRFDKIKELTKNVKDRIYELLINNFNYFG